MLNRLLDVALLGTRRADSAAERAPSSTRGARLYVRLSPEDRQLLGGRARGRDLREATYASLVLRAHLRGAAPRPKPELAALKHSIAELSAITRHLSQAVHAPHRGATSTGLTVEAGIKLIRVCELLRDKTRELVKANAASWRGGDRHG